MGNRFHLRVRFLFATQIEMIFKCPKINQTQLTYFHDDKCGVAFYRNFYVGAHSAMKWLSRNKPNKNNQLERNETKRKEYSRQERDAVVVQKWFPWNKKISVKMVTEKMRSTYLLPVVFILLSSSFLSLILWEAIDLQITNEKTLNS